MYNLATKTLLMSSINMPDPDYGDFNLQMFPFNNSENVTLPIQFSIWQEVFDKIRKMIPLTDGDNTHFVTISSKFFGQPGTLRREGLHLDGNFCGDPTFSYATWGGTTTTWGGVTTEKETWGGVVPTRETWGGIVPIQQKETWGGTTTTWAGASVDFDGEGWVAKKAWVDPFDTVVPIGKYVSDELGGIFLLSSLPGCELFTGEFTGIDVGNAGDLESQRELIEQQATSFIQGKDECWFISSNTPHESLEIDSGLRRSFIRVSLNCKYPNKLIDIGNN